MLNYQEFLDSIDPKAYHKGEWQWEEDGYTVTRTNQYSAPGCHDSCGVLFYVKDNKLCKVEGDPYQPYSGGKLCMRCLDLVEAVNHPDRLKYPLLRDGERGENKWKRISWEEAYDLIEQHVRDAWAKDGAESIMCLNGTGRNVTWQIPITSHIAFKTPNMHGVLSGHACYMPRLCGSAAIFGDYLIADSSLSHPDRYANSDWQNPEVIVVWANEPLTSNGDGYLGHWLAVCHQLGSKIISVDPRLTWWGARAEYFLQLRAGTDTALACAWLNVITTEDLIDHEFVDCWCASYDELKDSVKDMTPEWAGEICGLDPEQIRGSARLYAAGNNSTIQWGLAGDQQWSCMSLNLAHCELMAICGNVDVPGGNILIHNSFEINAGYASFEADVPEEAESRKLSTLFGLGIDAHDLCASAHPDANLFALESGKDIRGDDYPINMVWFHGSNNIACTAQDAPRWYEAWKKSPFNVVLDCFMTPTAIAAADLVLPIAMSCERNSARTWWVPARTMIKVTDFYEAKSDEQIGIDLAKRLNPEVLIDKYGITDEFSLLDWYLHGADRVSQSSSLDSGTYTDMAEGTFTKSWQELNEEGGWAYDEWNEAYKKYEKGMLRKDGSIGFNTPSGRAELVPIAYKYWGFPTTPEFVENPESPVSTPELFEEYPLVWSSGGRSYEFFHSEQRQLATMREFHPLPLFQINPEDAEKYGIVDGQWAWIENLHGRFRQVAEITVRVKPGFIHAEHGWWFPETEGAEPNLFGVFDSNPNCCTRAMNYGAAGLGSPIKGMICKVYPYKEGDMMPGEQVIEHGGFGDYIPGVLAPDRAKAEKILAEQNN